MIDGWLVTYRTHQPRLRLPGESREVLAALRPRWRLGVITNGLPLVQASKVEALGLAGLVDCVIYAAEHGSGLGKPEAAAFLAVVRELGVETGRTVLVGDDAERDVAGARAVGMRTILLARRGLVEDSDGVASDAVVRRLLDVVPLAGDLVSGGEGDGS